MGGWSGSGTVTLTRDFTDDAANTINAEAARVDENFEDVRGAIENCIAKDGQNTVTGNIPFGGRKITGYGTTSVPSASSDVPAILNIQSLTGVWAGTGGGTANAQTLTPSPAITTYVAGMTFYFIAGSTNTTTTPTMNVSAVGAKTIKKADGNGLLAGQITSGDLYGIQYDGTDFRIISQHIGPLNMVDDILQKPTIKDYGETGTTPTSSANAITFNVENGNHFFHTLTENTTLTISNPSPTGNLCPITVWIKQAAAGGPFTFTWPAAVKWIGSAPVQTTTASATDIYTLLSKDAGTSYAGVIVGQGYSGL